MESAFPGYDVNKAIDDLVHHHGLGQNLRGRTWPADTQLEKKLFGSLRELQTTAAYIGDTGVVIDLTSRGERERKRKDFPQA